MKIILLLLHCSKRNPNFRDITRNVEENEILHEIIRVVHICVPCYISCYITENRLPSGLCIISSLAQCFGRQVQEMFLGSTPCCVQTEPDCAPNVQKSCSGQKNNQITFRPKKFFTVYTAPYWASIACYWITLSKLFRYFLFLFYVYQEHPLLKELLSTSFKETMSRYFPLQFLLLT